MTPAHSAALIVLRESLGMLRGAIGGLPDEAFVWAPAAGTNSIAVLVTHSITSTRFWLRNGSGQVGSIVDRAGERARSFEIHDATRADLLDALAAFTNEAEELLGAAAEQALAVTIDWRGEDPNEPVHTGVEALFRALAHLREHIGQVQLMRDLWLARA